MGKIVGNVLLLLFLLSAQGIYADVLLRILNVDHSPLAQAAAGSPFLVEVSVRDMQSIGQPPVVKGLDQFEVKTKGVHITTVNSKITAKYTFEVRIDMPGTYTIGPALFSDQNHQEHSNKVRVIVGNEQIDAKNNTTEDKPVLLRLVANKDRAIIGECVHCWLRFYYTDPAITLRQFIEHDSKDICRKKVKGPHTGTQQLDGVDYNYIEWEWDIFPQKAGRCTIPAYGADYEQETEERDDFWGGLGRFLGSNIVTKRVYSNALSLDVDALPASTTPVQAVGNFSAMTLLAKPAVAKQQEGIVVAVEIIGDGDPDTIAFSTLQNLPEALRFYESNTTIIEPTKEGELPKKRYEFIVQGLKVGTWEIPSQALYYFDTKQRAFNTLHTMPLSITIMPSTKKVVTIQDNDDNHNDTKALRDDIAPLHKEWSYIAVPEWRLPWWFFLTLVVLPTLFLGYGSMSSMFVHNRQDAYRTHRAHHAFSTAKKRLEIMKASYNSQELYTLFIELFADRWQMPISTLSAGEIRQQLHAKGLHDTQLQEWDIFFACIAERAFGAKKGQEDTYLFDKAKQWIEQLEQFL